MPLMSTVLGRLGSRYSLTFDPFRRCLDYGALGLHCQERAHLLIGLEGPDGSGLYALPFWREGAQDFDCLEMEQRLCSLRFTGHCLDLGLRLTVEFLAPFYPRDERVSGVPAYLVDITVESFDRIRWTPVSREAPRSGVLRVQLDVPGASVRDAGAAVQLRYPVAARDRFGVDWNEDEFGGEAGVYARHVSRRGRAEDRLAVLEGPLRAMAGELRAPFEAPPGRGFHCRLALAGYVGDALFERFGGAMRLKYTEFWESAEAVIEWIRREQAGIIEKTRRFEAVASRSDLPSAARQTLALAFQSYLACTLRCVRAPETRSPRTPPEWFSVWEGSCWYNSTVDVTFNESPFYFAFWPELLEMLFAEWAEHAVDYAHELRRSGEMAAMTGRAAPREPGPWAGRVLEHDMGAGWTANGQAYHHLMPVEENANFLVLLYAHGRWWDRPALFRRYNELNKQLADYLLWADSTGNGFPDRGTANTIDDATPAVQYGRDNVYLGVKRLAALHAAARMFTETGETEYARRCREAVDRAVSLWNDGWLGDHWGVCLDKSARGLPDAWSGRTRREDGELEGWDAYHIYTANGLLPLFWIDDLPPGVDRVRLARDIRAAERACRTFYGDSHSSADRDHVWVSMNIWRDVAAAYLGIDMLDNAESYWNLQLFANGPGAEKANGFSETNLSNNLVLYPRGAAAFAWFFGVCRLTRTGDGVRARPLRPGRWPLLPAADWERGEIPWIETEPPDSAAAESGSGAGGAIA